MVGLQCLSYMVPERVTCLDCMFADVPALEELVDPYCVPDFFCGLAANGGIYVTPGKQTKAGLQYTDSCMCVQFNSMNAARLQIISNHLLAAGGPAGPVLARKDNYFKLEYSGHACQAALQVSLITTSVGQNWDACDMSIMIT